MLRTSRVFSFLAMVLCSLFLVKVAMAIEPIVVELSQQMTSVTPRVMNGDPTKIAGFDFESDLLFGNTKIGTCNGAITFQNPPMNLSVPVNNARIEGTMAFPGIGTCPFTGFSVTMGTRATPQNGEIMVTNTSSFGPCTESLEGMLGVSTGFGVENMFAPQAGEPVKMILRLLTGF